jgi:hypothetical protein
MTYVHPHLMQHLANAKLEDMRNAVQGSRHQRRARRRHRNR